MEKRPEVHPIQILDNTLVTVGFSSNDKDIVSFFSGFSSEQIGGKFEDALRIGAIALRNSFETLK